MDSAIFLSEAPATQPGTELEKVSVRRIRLALPRQRISASVGSFFAADRILSTWAGRAGGAPECEFEFEFEFEIVYDDGYTLAGEYRFRRSATARPALMGFIRKAVKHLCEGSAKGPLVRGLSDCPKGFLAHYEIADSMPAPEWENA